VNLKNTTDRFYRTRLAGSRLQAFQIKIHETDLMVLARDDYRDLVTTVVLQERRQLEQYIAGHPGFLESLRPWPADRLAPRLVKEMIQAGARVDVGPMAAVAGAMAAAVGRALLQHVPEVIVENGGDIFLKTDEPVTIALYAGNSPLSLKVGIWLPAEATPLGVCTSSGTVGHSLSFGRADAACVLAGDTALADAAATALGNRVKGPDDIPAALEWLAGIQEIMGGVVIAGDKLGAWGELELRPL
jgi:ApbE superfamily uncharacterized protein (UPF0280 family)